MSFHDRHQGRKVFFVVSLLIHTALFVLSAEAGIIYGRIHGAGFRGGESFVLMDGPRVVKRVQTDREGRYRFYIVPGSYEVRYPDPDTIRGSAYIHSVNSPIRVDIRLVETR